ncbi:MAG: rRNA maturation RNAse YbeY, partial [Bacteroidetes bacterium]|nr:rRNA maturation RNAse YbeY [Bacteroidota bacterium]
FNVSFEEELKRVLVHGMLHYCGYKDKSDEDEKAMRDKEDEKLLLFHVKQ